MNHCLSDKADCPTKTASQCRLLPTNACFNRPSLKNLPCIFVTLEHQKVLQKGSVEQAFVGRRNCAELEV